MLQSHLSPLITKADPFELITPLHWKQLVIDQLATSTKHKPNYSVDWLLFLHTNKWKFMHSDLPRNVKYPSLGRSIP